MISGSVWQVRRSIPFRTHDAVGWSSLAGAGAMFPNGTKEKIGRSDPAATWVSRTGPKPICRRALKSVGFEVLGALYGPWGTYWRVPACPSGHEAQAGPAHVPPVAAAMSQPARMMWETSDTTADPPGPPLRVPAGHPWLS